MFIGHNSYYVKYLLYLYSVNLLFNSFIVKVMSIDSIPSVDLVRLSKVFNLLCILSRKYSGSKDFVLSTSSNGTFHDQIDCALAALDTIYQDINFI